MKVFTLLIICWMCHVSTATPLDSLVKHPKRDVVVDDCEEGKGLEVSTASGEGFKIISGLTSLQSCISSCLLATDISCKSVNWNRNSGRCAIMEKTRYTDPDKYISSVDTYCTVKYEGQCDASRDDMDCCTSARPCGIGQGDCDDDSECAGPLVCGEDNYQTGSEMDVCSQPWGDGVRCGRNVLLRNGEPTQCNPHGEKPCCSASGWCGTDDYCACAGCVDYRPHPENDVRLVGGTSYTTGRVEVYHDGEWGSVCDDGFGLDEASMVCRSLGFSHATEVLSTYGGGSGPILLDGMDCPVDASDISECSHNGWGSHDCAHSEDVGVVCYQPGTAVVVDDCEEGKSLEVWTASGEGFKIITKLTSLQSCISSCLLATDISCKSVNWNGNSGQCAIMEKTRYTDPDKYVSSVDTYCTVKYEVGETINKDNCPGFSLDCCTSARPCGIGQGDCDDDSECAGPLVCGVDNYQTGSPMDVCSQP